MAWKSGVLVSAVPTVLIYLCLGVYSKDCAATEGTSEPEAPHSRDALALLAGIEQSRGAMTSGELTVSAEFTSPAIRNSQDLRIVFDGENVRCDELGAGKPRLVYDGENVTAFDGSSSATIHAREGQRETTCYMFDPRTLGINPFYYLDQGIEECVAYRNARSVKLAGSEVIDGVQAAKVEVIDLHGATRTFWINSEADFRVLKFEFFDGAHTKQSSTLQYEGGEVLPRQVTVQWFDVSGKEIPEKRVLAVKSAKFGGSFPKEMFTIRGLELPVGTSVTDIRVRQLLGYWNGKGLSDHVPSAKELQALQNGSRWWAKSLIALNIAVLVIVGAIMWRRRTSVIESQRS